MTELEKPIMNSDAVQDLPAPQRKAIAITALDNLSGEEQQDVVRKSKMARPGQVTTNTLWTILVAAFALLALIVGTAIAVTTNDMWDRYMVFFAALVSILVILALRFLQLFLQARQ